MDENTQVTFTQEDIAKYQKQISDLTAERDSLKTELSDFTAKHDKLAAELAETKKMNFTLVRHMEKPQQSAEDILKDMFE